MLLLLITDTREGGSYEDIAINGRYLSSHPDTL